MKNILALLAFLSVFMAIPAQARTFIEMVNYQWTPSTPGLDGSGNVILVHHYLVFERKNGVDTFLFNTPDATPKATVIRPYKRTFRVVVQAADKDGNTGEKSDVSADQTKIFPNFDYDSNRLVNAFDLGVFRQGPNVAAYFPMFREVYLNRVLGTANKEYVP